MMMMIIIIIIIIIITLLLLFSLVTGLFFPVLLKHGNPQSSGIKFQTAVLSVSHVMFQESCLL